MISGSRSAATTSVARPSSSQSAVAEPRAGQHHPDAGAAVQPRQEPAGADVRKEADAGLGHGQARPLGGDAVVGRQRDADAAAHGDAVHHRDDRLGVDRDQMVELVLGVEELERRRAALRGALGQHADVAAGAEAARAFVVDQHRLDGRIAAPLQQRRRHRLAHPKRQRAQRRGPVQRQPADGALAADDQFVSHRRYRRKSNVGKPRDAAATSSPPSRLAIARPLRRACQK